jgi:hypothetical protein
LLTNRMLANVPRAMTASFPRRDPYELNWRGTNLKDKVEQNMTSLGREGNEFWFAKKHYLVSSPLTPSRTSNGKLGWFWRYYQRERCDLWWRNLQDLTVPPHLQCCTSLEDWMSGRYRKRCLHLAINDTLTTIAVTSQSKLCYHFIKEWRTFYVRRFLIPRIE